MQVINQKLGVTYAPEELEHLKSLYESEQVSNKNHQVVEATVVSVNKKEVVVDLCLKSDATLSRSEFRSLPNLQAGDIVDVYVLEQENRHGQLIVSHKYAKKIKAFKKIEEAYNQQSILEGTVVSTSKGGLNVMIDDAETFMPGSQVDIAPVTDFEEFLGKTIDVIVLKINYDKDNIVVSHRALIEKDLEKQKKEIVRNLEKGQILEGVVRNVTSFGAFVDMGGLVGLVYVKHMVWDKRIDHPDKVKDENGEPIFKKDKKIKVVVKDFDEEKTRISLSTRELLPNPWEELSPEIKEGAVINGVVSKILERGVFVKVEKLVEAFMYIADLSHSHYVSHPTDIVQLGDEVEVKVLTLDREAQEFRVGMKQLLPEPFGTADFFKKYGLNTCHKGIVRRFTDQGAYVEVEPGVEGFLHTRNMSWTKKVKYPGQILRKKQELDVLVLNVDEERKLLELGLRELEDSPWEKFETIFIPGTVHEGTVVKLFPKGVAAIVELSYGLECKVESDQLIKADKNLLQEEEIAQFVVLDFSREKQRVLISHTATFDKKAGQINTKNRNQSDRAIDSFVQKKTKTTLGDLTALSDLKDKLARQKDTKEEK